MFFRVYAINSRIRRCGKVNRRKLLCLSALRVVDKSGMDGKDRVSVHKSHQFASVLFDLFQARRHVKQTSINSDKIIFKA